MAFRFHLEFEANGNLGDQKKMNVPEMIDLQDSLGEIRIEILEYGWLFVSRIGNPPIDRGPVFFNHEPDLKKAVKDAMALARKK